MVISNNIPDDIFFEIFSYIDIIERQRLQRVCKQWRRIIQRMWRSMNKLKFSWSNIEVNNSSCISRNSGWSHIYRRDINDFGKILQLFDGNLIKLNVSDHYFHDKQTPSADTFALLRQNTDLKTVRIKTLDGDMVKNFLASLPAKNLQHLSISGIKNHETTKLIEEILMETQALTYLYLDKITISTLRIIGNMSTLKSLHIKHSMESLLRLWSVFSSDTKLSNLESLSICDSSIINDNFLLELTQNCKQLRNLILYCDDNVSVTGLNAIGTLRNLRYLELRGVWGFNFLRHWSNLEELYCELSVDDLSNDQLNSLHDVLSHLINLKACNFFNDKINLFLNERGFDRQLVNSNHNGLFHHKELDQLFDVQ